MRFEIQSNAVDVLRKVQSFPQRMGVAICRAMDLENEITVGYIQARKLSQRGPLTLGVVTNRLRSSIRPSAARVNATGTDVESSIGSNVAYAAPHEFGFDGVVAVRSFTRKNPRGNLYGATTRTFDPKTGRVSKAKPKPSAAGISIVKAHNRHMRLPERAFIRTSITERAADYGTAISKAIVESWEGGS